ncbi:NADH(P)-binding protein [Gulosibacter sp. 10]|uniref:NADH(P)-binding protein n=1 Tax=Gulosibacter sp. 10 TaxID=1255570 RepID=UPI00097F6B78|nr:NADH(P)-binding protein [Gulosibacter sp. 10]SJM69171.1 hypothetical protein FM112_14025 [Gulosibacter sp. 10]
MSHIAVVGGGRSGPAIQQALEERGARVTMLSRTTGFDVLHDDLAGRVPDADAIIEAAGRFTISRSEATSFFTASTRMVASAANRLGVPHVLLSIVNCDAPSLQGYGYLAGKAAQERVARRESERLTIVRSSQWFEFAEQNLERMRFGPIALVPAMLLQPVALDAVAAVLADCALGRREGDLHNIVGPDRMTLWEMTRQLPTEGSPKPVPLRIPTRYGRAFHQGAFLPRRDFETHGPRFAEWLRG